MFCPHPRCGLGLFVCHCGQSYCFNCEQGKCPKCKYNPMQSDTRGDSDDDGFEDEEYDD